MTNHHADDADLLDDFDVRTSVRHLADCLAAGAAIDALRATGPASREFERIFETSHTALQMGSVDGRRSRVNRAFADFLGTAVDDLVEAPPPGETVRLDQGGADDAIPASAAVDAGGPRTPGIRRYLRADGRTVWGAVTDVEVDSADGRIRLTQVVDVTQPVEVIVGAVSARRELADRAERYRALTLPVPDPVFRLSADGIVIEQNDAANELFGLDDRAGDDVAQILPFEARGRVRRMIAASLADGRSHRIDRQRLRIEGDETPRWFMLRVAPDLTGDPARSVHLVLGDVTRHVEDETRLTTLALTDPHTGIPNRAAACDRLDHAIKALKRRPGSGVAVLAVDIDNFKSLNDVYGHAFGDSALIQFAERATGAIREHDTVGRLGGDEFLVIIEDVGDVELARHAAERIAVRMNPFTASVDGGPSVKVSTSMGLAWTSEPVEVSSLIAAADNNLMLAKRNGRGRLWILDDVDVSPRSGHVTRSTRLGELLHAIEQQEFVVHYQPVVDREHELVAVEALVRWQHPVHGLMTPDSFVQLLIETGQMATVGTWVMETAISQVARWRTDFGSNVRLNVNASAGEIGRAEYRLLLQQMVERSGVEAGIVSVELTEQALSGSMVSESALDELASFGVNVVLDDFGTGISSLAHLRTASLTGVKIDRSFVSDTHDGDIDRRIVRGVTQLAHEVGVEVTAEGVETEEQSDWIRSIGCDFLQGFYFGRPVDADTIGDLVASTVVRAPRPV